LSAKEISDKVPNSPSTALSVDMLAPEGYGEIIGGGACSPEIEAAAAEVGKYIALSGSI